MQAGRPPKPTALKRLQGTDRADRVLEDEMMPSLLEAVPSAPGFLSPDAKKEWRSVCRELLALDMLHGVDLALLAAYCNEMAGYIEAEGEVLRQGAVTSLERPDGSEYLMQNPWVNIRNSRLKNAQSLANQFGFTPAARTRIRAEAKPKENDPFDEMLNSDK